MSGYDKKDILDGTCSLRMVENFTYLARACDDGDYEVVKALALPPYSLPKSEWIAQDWAASGYSIYVCAFSYCYSQKGQHMLKELVNPPWSFTPEEIYNGAFWCFMFDNTSLFESIVGPMGPSVQLQETIIGMASKNRAGFRRGLEYVNGSVLLNAVTMDFGRDGLLFDARFGPELIGSRTDLAFFALKRRGYALFMATRAFKNPDSPLTLLSPHLINKIAGLMVVAFT